MGWDGMGEITGWAQGGPGVHTHTSVAHSSTTPVRGYLCEGVLLGVAGLTGEAERELLAAPEAGRPLVHTHHPVAAAGGGVDLNRVTRHHLHMCVCGAEGTGRLRLRGQQQHRACCEASPPPAAPWPTPRGAP